MNPDRSWSVSFCTTCRNRLQHLEQTLGHNLNALADCSVPTELLLLDYGSSDGLEDWLKSHHWDAVESGRICVYRTDEPVYYDSSHAKNVIHRLGRHDLLCNLDADNFLADGFIEEMLRLLSTADNLVLFGRGGSRGRVVIRQDDFHTLGGYDEDFIGWGHDDVDLTRRAAASLGRVELKMDRQFDRYIKHGHLLRTQEMPFKNIGRSRERNKRLSLANVAARRFVANAGRPWGAARVCVNYDRSREFETTNAGQANQKSGL